jgi:hypothetical protein
MKYWRSHASFIGTLRHKIRSLKRLGPNDVYVFTVNANYGHYQITVGPMNDHRKREVEIKGEMHHLFVTPHSIAPNPAKKQVNCTMRNTVVMRNLEVHLVDPEGDGKHLSTKSSDARPREYINLAGKNGELLMRNLESGTRLQKAIYGIIQKDILNSLELEETSEG